jgi:hypothetical protein
MADNIAWEVTTEQLRLDDATLTAQELPLLQFRDQVNSQVVITQKVLKRDCFLGNQNGRPAAEYIIYNHLKYHMDNN